MNNYHTRDQEVLALLYGLGAGLPYNPASYTSVREFVDNFPKETKPKFVPDPAPKQQYTKGYRKTLLST